MPNVMVTGASGLIGSRIVTMLRDHDLPVIATARRPTPQLSQDLGVDVHALDVLAARDFTANNAAIDCLIHCATANDILSKDVSRGMDLSVAGTWNVLELARSLGVSQVFFFSTFQVYGTELVGTIDETVPPHCESAYGLNHWFGEEVCRLFAEKHGMSIAVLRPANVYGVPVAATVNRQTLVPTCFVKAALEQQQLVLHSSGLQQRNFVSTEEVARACLHLVREPVQGYQIFNVCSAYNATIREVAELTAAVYGERFGRELPVQSLSELPRQSNVFVAQSRLRHLWSTAEQSRRQLRLTIENLFDLMSCPNQDVTAHSINEERKYGSHC